MNFRKFSLLVLGLGCFAIVFVGCGKSDEEELLDCYEEFIDESAISAYSMAIEAWSLDPTNSELCKEVNATLTDYLLQLTNYSKCVREYGVAVRAGFENIDELIDELEDGSAEFDC